jgi:aminopeptidase N/puromycin-sensitive aminopeptidase
MPKLLRFVLFALTLLTAHFIPVLNAQRLPQTVRPEHYDLTLAPDLKAATFTGKEAIDIILTGPSDTIVLNAAEIKFQSVTTTVAGKTVTAKVATDEDKQQATLTFAEKLPSGKLRLNIEFTGILNNELRGFYLSKTSKRNYAVTQFESTDARRAFPSFDEPAFKATFDVTLVIDKGDTAISNTNIVKDVPQNDAKHALTFATTPKMSTYLVAFLVGDFQCLSGSSDGTPIRVCATPDQVQYGEFALKATEYTLHYYNTYFGIKYPMPKLDMIAIPDFEAGAMENFGAITYRETDLLLDSSHASVNAQRNVALVVAHEMAHQWFGDMVTMQWWDNIWLNEGFASWMENKPVEAWKPEWNIPEEVAQGNQDTLDLDAQKVTRTIRAKADTPDEINEMFDGISYGKAGAVLLMVEHYLGKETFRKGVHTYLTAHLFSNATAEDFWSAQTKTSHKPIDKIMDSLVSQPGEPLLTLDPVKGSAVSVTQRRFFLNPTSRTDQAETWTLPVCFKAGAQANCELLTANRQQLSVSGSNYLFANAEGKGYYRTNYPTDMYRAILPHVESDLTPEERISLLGDQWALTRANISTVADYLDLVATVKADPTSQVIGSAAASLNTIDSRIAATSEERAQLAAWIKAQFAPALRSLGDPQSTDTPGKRELRAQLLALVAGLGNDSEAIAQAKLITARSLTDPASVDPTLSDTALRIAARNGDEALFNQLQKASADAPNPQFRSAALYALALFRDPALEKRTLDYAVSGQVRNQDSAGLLAIALRLSDTREYAWTYIRQNWDKVAAQITTSSGAYIVGATGSFCSTDKRDEVATFFNAHKVPATERTLAKAKDEINDCIALRTSQEPNLKAWLSKR